MNDPINIGILEMSDVSDAILTFFFESSGKELFTAVKLDDASAFIIDFDIPVAEKMWQQTFNWTSKPGIIISTEEVKLDSTIWVSKPLTVEKLTQAEIKLREILESRISLEISAENDDLQQLLDEVLEEAGEDQKQPIEGLRSRGDITKEQRYELICGDILTASKSINLAKNSYNPNEYMLATFIQALEQARATKDVYMLRFFGINIIIDTFIDTISCNISIMDSAYAEACFDPLVKKSVKIYTLDDSEVRMHRKRVRSLPENRYPIRSFIWTTSLLTARGRLPENTDIYQTVSLREMPRIGNLESFPYLVDIAKSFRKKSKNLYDTVNAGEYPQSFIFSFYNGAIALGLFEDNSMTLFKPKRRKDDIKKKSFSDIFKERKKLFIE